MDYAFDITLKNRKILLSYLDTISLEDLNKIPENFNNNIFWNIAHVVITQQLLIYGLSKVPLLVSNEMADLYRKGSKPERNATQKEVDEMKGLLMSLLEQTKKDYNNGTFKNYKEYTVSTKTILKNVENAIEFNNFHEGIHLGVIFSILKFI